MTKEFKTLKSANADFMRPSPPAAELVRHLILVSIDPDDVITIPVCGEIDEGVVGIVGTRRWRRVTCRKCLTTMLHLATIDTYADALTHVTSIAPTAAEPDKTKLEERIGGRYTKAAEIHRQAQSFLDHKGLTRASDLPKNIIGSEKGTFYSNLFENSLIDEEGEPNVTVIAEWQGVIDALPTE